MICFTSSLLRQLYHFATYFDCELLQLVSSDIEKNLFKYKVGYKHLAVMMETFELLMKSCEKFYLLFVHIQKSELDGLNCCSWGTISVIWIKFAGYVAWMLAYKVWKFGSNPYTPMAKIEHFCKAVFFIGAPCKLIFGLACVSVRCLLCTAAALFLSFLSSLFIVEH